MYLHRLFFFFSFLFLFSCSFLEVIHVYASHLHMSVLVVSSQARNDKTWSSYRICLAYELYPMFYIRLLKAEETERDG
ncbi:hypothetical protein GGR52DRAFT_525121 [Hypoxylon sp. FL1284]|nr:hypothetical protein GGR52DRAFT_525121 [Hypoxylon sp. FL1284]